MPTPSMSADATLLTSGISLSSPYGFYGHCDFMSGYFWKPEGETHSDCFGKAEVGHVS
jgi:hypothetical protein